MSEYHYKIVRTFVDGKTVEWQETVCDLNSGFYEVLVGDDPDSISVRHQISRPTGSTTSFHRHDCPVGPMHVLTKAFTYRPEECNCG